MALPPNPSKADYIKHEVGKLLEADDDDNWAETTAKGIGSFFAEPAVKTGANIGAMITDSGIGDYIPGWDGGDQKTEFGENDVYDAIFSIPALKGLKLGPKALKKLVDLGKKGGLSKVVSQLKKTVSKSKGASKGASKSSKFDNPKVNGQKNTPGSDGGGLGYPKGAGMPPKTAGGATPKQGVDGKNTFSNVPKNQQGGKGAGSASGNKATGSNKATGDKKTIKADGDGTKSPSTTTPKTDAPKSKFDSVKDVVKKTATGTGLVGAGVVAGQAMSGGSEPPAEEEQKVDPAVVTSPDNVLTDRQKELVAQGQELAQAKTQNAIDKENGIVDFDDPRELQGLQMGLPDNVKSGTRVLPNRLKQQLQADTKGALIRQQQQAKNDRRKQATVDHNATTMREDPNIANIADVFDKTGGRGEGAFDALNDAEKQQMVRNYYMNETNSSQKRQRLQDIAGKDALVGNIYKDGKLQAGDANYSTDEYFANKKGFNDEQFTKGTGLKHKGTGIVGTNTTDTVNEGKKATLEMGDRFDEAGGEASAQPFLTDAQKSVLGHQVERGGTFTDEFGQQSAMNEDTKRMTNDERDYSDANFDTPEKALAYLNRSKEDIPEEPPEEETETAPVTPTPPDDGGQGVPQTAPFLPTAINILSKLKKKGRAKVRKAEAPTPKSKSFDNPVPKQATPVQQPAQPVKKPAPQPTYKTMDGQTKPIPKVTSSDPMLSKDLPKSPLDIPAKSTGLPATTPRTPVSAPSPTQTKPRPGVFDQGVPKTNPKTNMNNGRVEVAPNNRPSKPNFEEPEEILRRKLAQQTAGVN